jgi:glycosyltransferase involved in cell wall biosynthesis
MKIALITNIPTPYRLPVYEIINHKYGKDFLVLFAARSEPNRSWDFSSLKFNHLFLKENVKAKKDGFNYVHNNTDIFLELKKFKPDIVITTGFNPTHLYAWLYTKLNRIKHICMTDGWLESEKDLSFIHKLARKMVFKSSHAFIGAGKNSLNLYRSYGIDDNKLFQSHLCIDNKLFKNDKLYSDRTYDFIFSGQFTERKSPILFAEIVKKVSKDIPNLKVLILGNGPLKNEFLNKLKKFKINYYYAGFVSQEELPKYYSNARLLLFTTRLDAWGLVVNEAMASGTPVLTTPFAGVVNDLLIHDINGYIFEASSSIWVKKSVEILNDSHLWEKLSKNAKESVKEFNFDNAAKGITDACEYV